MHVALVGCRAIERIRTEDAVAGLLEDHGGSAHVQAEAAQLGTELRSEQPGPLSLTLQLLPQRIGDPVATKIARLGGDHDRVNELSHPGPKLDQLWLRLQVDHRDASFTLAVEDCG